MVKPINHRELVELHKEWDEAEKRTKERHHQELRALKKHYDKMFHDIIFPPRKNED